MNESRNGAAINALVAATTPETSRRSTRFSQKMFQGKRCCALTRTRVPTT